MVRWDFPSLIGFLFPRLDFFSRTFLFQKLVLDFSFDFFKLLFQLFFQTFVSNFFSHFPLNFVFKLLFKLWFWTFIQTLTSNICSNFVSIFFQFFINFGSNFIFELCFATLKRKKGRSGVYLGEMNEGVRVLWKGKWRRVHLFLRYACAVVVLRSERFFTSRRACGHAQISQPPTQKATWWAWPKLNPH